MPPRTLLLAFLLVPAVAAAQVKAKPPPAGRADPLMAPVDRMLARVSFGPTAGLGPTVGTRGPGALVTLGLGFMLFDLWGQPDPACEERRKKERAQLGGEKLKAWGELLDKAQQPCRPLDQGFRPAYDAGLELGFGLGFTSGQARVGQLRGYFAPVAFGDFTLGLSAAGVAGERATGGSAVGLRLGAELGWHQRFEGAQARHVLSVVLRPEVSLLSADTLPHQVVLGARFLFDL